MRRTKVERSRDQAKRLAFRMIKVIAPCRNDEQAIQVGTVILLVSAIYSNEIQAYPKSEDCAIEHDNMYSHASKASIANPGRIGVV